MAQGEWCWVSADGHLESGSERDLYAAHAAGRIPDDNPVWCAASNAWRTMFDLTERSQRAANVERARARVLAAAAKRVRVDTATLTTVRDNEIPPSTERDLPWFTVDEDELATERIELAPPPRPEASGLTRPPAAALRAPRVERPLSPVQPAPAPLQEALYAQPPASIRPTVRTLPPASAVRLPVLVGGGLAAAGLMVACVLVGVSLLERAPDALGRGVAEHDEPPELSTSGLRAQPLATQCRQTLAPRRVTSLVVPGSALTLASFGDELAVGAVTSERTGVGLTLSTRDLSVTATQWLADPKHVSAVVPATGNGFITDRWTQSVPGTSDFTVGMTPGGFTRIDADLGQTPIWAGGAREAITRPVIARAPGLGWAIAFRRGDEPGRVELGFVDQNGDRLGDLTSFGAGAESVGQPALAIDSGRLALAFAERRAGGPWRIRVGQSKSGSAPRELRSFGDDARAPAIVSRGKDGWLLGWIEGKGRAERVLRARLLDAELRPVGSTLTLGDAPGALPSVAAWRSGNRTTLLFTREANAQRAELWAVAIECD